MSSTIKYKYWYWLLSEGAYTNRELHQDEKLSIVKSVNVLSRKTLFFIKKKKKKSFNLRTQSS